MAGTKNSNTATINYETLKHPYVKMGLQVSFLNFVGNAFLLLRHKKKRYLVIIKNYPKKYHIDKVPLKFIILMIALILGKSDPKYTTEFIKFQYVRIDKAYF